MRKIITALAFVLALGFFVPNLLAANDITVTIDGAAVNFADQQPVIVDGRTLVPVRDVFEQLGFYVSWDDDLRQATLTNDDYTVIITINSDVFTANGAEHELDVPAQTIGGRAMVPLRRVLESVGYYLDWDEDTQAVLIASAPAAVPIAGHEQLPEIVEQVSEKEQVQQVEPAQPLAEVPAYITIRGQQISTAETYLHLSGRA